MLVGGTDCGVHAFRNRGRFELLEFHDFGLDGVPVFCLLCHCFCTFVAKRPTRIARLVLEMEVQSDLLRADASEAKEADQCTVPLAESFRVHGPVN
jgi:hypothetical protein